MIQAKAGRTSEVQVLSSSQSCESPRQGKLTETCLHILSDTLPALAASSPHPTWPASTMLGKSASRDDEDCFSRCAGRLKPW